MATVASVAAVSLGLGVVIVASAWTFSPRIGAGETPPAEVMPLDPERERATRLLAGLLESGRGIIAVHPAGAVSPFLEVVLLSGSDRRRPEDLVLLTFHRRMERIFVYAVAEDASPRDLDRATAALVGIDPSSPRFPERWRELAAITRRTLLRDIEALELVDTGPAVDGRVGLELRLRWTTDRADQNDEARIVIEAIRIED